MITRGSRVPTLNTETRWWRAPFHALRFLLTRRGPITSPVGHAQLFFRTQPYLALPNIQMILVPLAYQMDTLQEGITPSSQPGDESRPPASSIRDNAGVFRCDRRIRRPCR